MGIILGNVVGSGERERDLPSVFAAAVLPLLTPNLTLRLHHEVRAECTVENPPNPWNFTRSI